MDDLDQQNTGFEDDEHIQITDLDPGGSRQKRLLENVILTLHKGVATPWIRYSTLSFLLIVLLGATFLQIHQSAPPISSTPTVSYNSPITVTNVIYGDDQIYMQTSDGILTTYRDENGQILWRTKLPKQASIEVAGQLFYAYYITSLGHATIEALNGNNGHVLWQHAMPAPGTNTALRRVGDALYAADASNTIYAFQISNGHLRWSYHAPDQPSLPIDILLQVRNGIAEIARFDRNTDLLSASDGRKIVQIPHDSSDNPRQIILDGQLIYAIDYIDNDSLKQPVQVFRASDGKRLWSWTAQITSMSEAVLVHDTGIIGQEDGIINSRQDALALTALRDSDGHILWTYQASAHNAILSTALETDGTIHLILQDGTIIHLRANDGQLLWRTQVKIDSQQFTNPYSLLDNGILFLISTHGSAAQSDDQIDALRASDGKLLWHTTGYLGNPLFQSGLYYTMRTEGRLDAWRESDGGHLWSYKAPAETNFSGDPSGKNKLILLTDLPGDIEVLRTNDGKLLWRTQKK